MGEGGEEEEEEEEEEPLLRHDSGKEKAHKHKQFCPVTAWVRRGVS